MMAARHTCVHVWSTGRGQLSAVTLLQPWHTRPALSQLGLCLCADWADLDS
jgi:hypothetical protein